MPDNKSVNKALKTAIFNIKRDFDLKQSEIADQLDIKSTYLSDMINGGVPFSEPVSKKIYEVFHIKVTSDETNNSQSIPIEQGNFKEMLCQMYERGEIYSATVVKEKNELIHNLYKEIGRMEAKIEEMEGKKTSVPG